MSGQGFHVLVVDDEPQIRRLLQASLSAQGYRVATAATGEEGLSKAAIEHPDLIILDLGLPDLDGQQIIRRLREWSEVPIIVLSVREDEVDKVTALDQGADDYVTKPFGMDELFARIRATMRHRLHAQVDEPIFRSGRLTVDLSKRVVQMGGQEVQLAPKEYDILRMLVVHAGKVITHQQLLREVWGPSFVQRTHYLRIHIGHLRRKLEADASQPQYIITEPAVGYRLKVLDEQEGGT